MNLTHTDLLAALHRLSGLSKYTRENRNSAFISSVAENRVVLVAGHVGVGMAGIYLDSTDGEIEPTSFNLPTALSFLGASHQDNIVSVTRTPKRLKMEIGRSKSLLPVLGTWDYRENLPVVDKTQNFLPAAVVGYMNSISKLTKQDPKSLFSGVNLVFDDYVRVLATDSFSTGYVWYKQTNKVDIGAESIVIPALAVENGLSRLFTDESGLYINREDNKLIFGTDNFVLQTVAMANGRDFPTEMIINAMGAENLVDTVIIDTYELIDKISACAGIYVDNANVSQVIFETGPDEVKVYNQASQNGSNEFYIPIRNISGTDIRFCLNAKFVGNGIAFLKAISNNIPNISISHHESNSWCFFSAAGLDARVAFAKVGT